MEKSLLFGKTPMGLWLQRWSRWMRVTTMETKYRRISFKLIIQTLNDPLIERLGRWGLRGLGLDRRVERQEIRVLVGRGGPSKMAVGRAERIWVIQWESPIMKCGEIKQWHVLLSLKIVFCWNGLFIRKRLLMPALCWSNFTEWGKEVVVRWGDEDGGKPSDTQNTWECPRNSDSGKEVTSWPWGGPSGEAPEMGSGPHLPNVHTGGDGWFILIDFKGTKGRIWGHQCDRHLVECMPKIFPSLLFTF